MENKIITINDKDEYYVLKEMTVEGKKYIFCSKYNEKDESISENNFLVMEVALKENNLQLVDIEDNNVAARITKMFLAEMKKQ